MSAAAQVFDPFLLNVMGMPQAIKNATLYPYAVRVTYQLPADAAVREACAILEAFGDERPDATALVPDGAELLSATVMPLEDLVTMRQEQRASHVGEYRAYRMWLVSRRVNKPIDQLRGWVDYDVIVEDDAVHNWLRPGRYCGD